MKLSAYSDSSAGIVGSPKRSIGRSSSGDGRIASRPRWTQATPNKVTDVPAKLPISSPFAPSSRITTSQTVSAIVNSTLPKLAAK